MARVRVSSLVVEGPEVTNSWTVRKLVLTEVSRSLRRRRNHWRLRYSLLTQIKSSLLSWPVLWPVLTLWRRDWRMLAKGVTPIPVATRTACSELKTVEEGALCGPSINTRTPARPASV